MEKFARGGIETAKVISNSSRIVGNLLLLPAGILFIVQILIRSRGKGLLYVLAGVGIPLSIMALAIIGGKAPPIRAMYALPFASAFMFFYLIIGARKTVARVITILALLTSVNQAQITAQLFYSDYVRYLDDVQVAEELDRRITPLQNYGDTMPKLPIAIVGAHRATVVFSVNFLPGDVSGHSFFEWNASKSFEGGQRGIGFMQVLGMPYMGVTESQMDAARSAAQSMPSYPAPGCIQRLPDMIVVKLSESTYQMRD
jgi:hypothetical protein